MNYNLHDANVKCAYRIAKCAKEAGVKRFIQVSTVGTDTKKFINMVKIKGRR